MNHSKIYDAVIVGAGPAGMTAAMFAHNKNLQVVIVEGKKAGGQMKNLYPYKPVYNYPGYSQITAGELADRMIDQVKENHIDLLENAPIVSINRDNNGIFTVLGEQFQFVSRGIILSSGLGLFEPRRLNIQGEQELTNKGIEYNVTQISDWRHKTIAVIGGGNSALDNALLLTEHGCRVTLLHQLNTFQAEPLSVEKLHQTNATLLSGRKTLRFQPISNDIIQLTVEHVNTGDQFELNVEKVLINIGLKPQLKFLDTMKLETKGKQIKVDTEMRTSIDGILGCGDAVFYLGKVRLIVTAIGEAATAVNSLQHYLKSIQKTEESVGVS